MPNRAPKVAIFDAFQRLAFVHLTRPYGTPPYCARTSILSILDELSRIPNAKDTRELTHAQ